MIFANANNLITCADTSFLTDTSLQLSSANYEKQLPFAIYHPVECKDLYLNLGQENTGQIRIEILDEYGNTIKLFTNKNLNRTKDIVHLDMEGLDSKVYFLLGSFNERTEIRKLVIK